MSSPVKPETLEKFKRAKELIAAGKPIQEACKEVSLSYSHFYYLKKRDKKPRKRTKTKPTMTEVEVLQKQILENHGGIMPPVKTGNLFMFMGGPEQMAEFMRTMSQ